MFNNYLHFIEIKAVLEGRGFSPPLRSAQTFGKIKEVTYPPGQGRHQA